MKKNSELILQQQNFASLKVGYEIGIDSSD